MAAAAAAAAAAAGEPEYENAQGGVLVRPAAAAAAACVLCACVWLWRSTRLVPNGVKSSDSAYASITSALLASVLVFLRLAPVFCGFGGEPHGCSV